MGIGREITSLKSALSINDMSSSVLYMLVAM